MTPVILNIHERLIPASGDAVGKMIDTLGSAGDVVWPGDWSRRVVFLRWLVRNSGGHRRRK